MDYVVSLYVATKDSYIRLYDVAKCSTYQKAEKKTKYLNEKLGLKEDECGFMFCPEGTRFYMFE